MRVGILVATVKYAILRVWKDSPHSRICRFLGEIVHALWHPPQRHEVIGTLRFAISGAEIYKHVLHIVLLREGASALVPDAVSDRLSGLGLLMKARELEVSYQKITSVPLTSKNSTHTFSSADELLPLPLYPHPKRRNQAKTPMTFSLGKRLTLVTLIT